MTTLGEMPRKDPTCSVCGVGFTSQEPIAWTVGRERIHESSSSRGWPRRGRAKFGPWKAPAVRPFLQRTGGCLCASCLAMALNVSLDQARDVIRVVDGVDGLRVLPVSCVSCGRASAALCVVPASSGSRVAS